MASFLRVAPGGMQFNGSDLSAWYAAAEVGYHLRREAGATGVPELKRTYRTYTAMLAGQFTDLRGQAPTRPDLYDSAS